MTYDHAVTNQISSWIRNVTCSSAISQALIMYVALGFKIMTLTSIQHTGTLIFFPQRLMVGCFQAFDSIFPLGRRPPTPQPPNNTPRNSCIPPSSGQPPFYKPHTTHIPLIAPTKGQHSKHQLYGGKFGIITSVNETKLSSLTEYLIHITQKY